LNRASRKGPLSSFNEYVRTDPLAQLAYVLGDKLGARL